MGLDMYLSARIVAPKGSELAEIVEKYLTPERAKELDDDGYLYISGWQWPGRNPDDLYLALVEKMGITPDEGSPHINVERDGDGFAIEPCIIYWRKANAIHQWFVDNTQDGVDECQRTVVHSESLMDLLTRCEKIADDHRLASELLPTQGGFFFGSTDYDDWYFKDVEGTVETLRRQVAATPKRAEFVYHSSW